MTLRTLIDEYRGNIILEYWGDDKVFVSTDDDPLGFFVSSDDVYVVCGPNIHQKVMESGRASINNP